MLRYSGIVFPSNFSNLHLINFAIKLASFWPYLRLSFMRNSKRSSSLDHSLPLSLHALPPTPMSVLWFLDPAIFFMSYPFHRNRSQSPHSLLVSENKPPSVIAVLVGFYRHSKSPHSFSFNVIECMG